MPARRLPAEPSLEHVRNEAKALCRRVRAADADAVAMVREFHPRFAEIDRHNFRRADALLVVARQYGFASWNQLRRHVAVVVRPVRSLAELADVFTVVGAQGDPPITCADRRYADQERRFPRDRPLMLAAEADGAIIGGGFAFRLDESPSCRVAKLRNVAVVAAYRELGLERRLIERIELGAVGLGVREIILGGPQGVARQFFLGMGYRGRHEGGLMRKELPMPVRQRYPDGWRQHLDELRRRRRTRQAAAT